MLPVGGLPVVIVVSCVAPFGLDGPKVLATVVVGPVVPVYVVLACPMGTVG